MSSPDLIRVESIDDYLGDGTTRFFATGFRRVNHEVGDLAVSMGAGRAPGVEATATLRYPRDWSAKADGIDLRPHLSTVDMLVLGLQLAETYLAHAWSLDPALRRSSRVRKVALRAGTTPQEDLVGVPLAAKLLGSEPVAGRPGWHLSRFDCRAGVMKARCDIEHPIGTRAAKDGRYDSTDSLLGDPLDRYYGEGFKSRRQVIEKVEMDMGALRADATVAVVPIDVWRTLDKGLDGARQPSVSMVDCFVVTLQLAQLLMYELDSVDRWRTNTLWMLRTTLEAGDQPRTIGRLVTATATIVGKELLPLRGRTWRNVDIVGECGGIGLRATFAHELPTEVGAEAV